MTNPFENDDWAYLVLMNDEEQYSLWPEPIDVPAGWTVVHGPGDRAEMTAYVEREWVDMRPKSLREAMAEGA
ncbi:MbtH family protein [Kibdelosporangium persicum]|uniref:Antibiotic synthesis protein MbtH n=1 Tax=Kibdelosporangium persicum TaxID=2698649 RepID=A0ABX2FIS0_9PSEU|nr:MbtH family protein [Kibdelosporangium persicum]NRN71318.1 Antibiotic synthesis protein MbtH [Kibdelosporangium persicum]